MSITKTASRLAGGVSLVVLASAAAPALAQLTGGVSVSGNQNPVSVAQAAVTLLLAISGVATVAAWAKVGLAHYSGRGVEPRYIWGAVIGTVILGGCAAIAARLLDGGGGLSL